MNGKFVALIGLTLGLLIPSAHASTAVDMRLSGPFVKGLVVQAIPSVHRNWLSMVTATRLGSGIYHITGKVGRQSFLTVRDRFNRFCFSVQGTN